MQHCALQHSAWHGICMEQMRLLGMNLAGVGGDGGASNVDLNRTSPTLGKLPITLHLRRTLKPDTVTTSTTQLEQANAIDTQGPGNKPLLATGSPEAEQGRQAERTLPCGH